MLLLFFQLILFSQSLEAKTFTLLNEKGYSVRTYNHETENLAKELTLHPGTPQTVQMGKGKSFEVVRYLGSGAQSHILLLDDGRVLRIRKYRYSMNPFASMNPFNKKMSAFADGIGTYIRGMKELKEAGIPTVTVYADESDGFRYVVTDYVPHDAVYGHYMHGEYRNNQPIPKHVLKKMDDDLVDFAKKSAEYTMIRDFNSGSLVHTKEGWMVMDVGDDHIRNGSPDGPTSNIFIEDKTDKLLNMEAHQSKTGGIMIDKPGLPERVKNRVLDAIQEERKARFKAEQALQAQVCPTSGTFLKRLFSKRK